MNDKLYHNAGKHVPVSNDFRNINGFCDHCWLYTKTGWAYIWCRPFVANIANRYLLLVFSLAFLSGTPELHYALNFDINKLSIQLINNIHILQDHKKYILRSVQSANT